MTAEQAKEYLTNTYICCCPYGNSPFNCEDKDCRFGQAIRALISQGKWVFLKANEEQTDGYECSVCKTTYHTKVPYFSEFNFCPNCGAYMRGD